jgi:seryl-tRNA synthetase
MLDIRLVREEADRVRRGCEAKGIPAHVDKILEVDAERRRLLQDLEALQRERNSRSREIGRKMKAGEDAGADQAEVRHLGERIKELEEARRGLEDRLQELMLEVPNLPDPSVPIGKDAADNVIVREVGPEPRFDFEPKPHWEIGEELGILDFERGVKITGSGFPVYRGWGAKLERALISYFLDAHGGDGGYEEIFPPILVNADSATGTGQLPDKEDQMYVAARDDLYLVPTAEVPVTNLHRDEILPVEKLPLRYVAYTPNFRREAGSHGRDVRGLNRVHQFNKVELVHFVEPAKSEEELEKLLAAAEGVLRALGLRYRVVLLCTGDMGFTQTKTYDLEVWAPGQGKWLEVSSCSCFGDFQARRMRIRYRPEAGKPAFVHTLNGSGLATPRTYVGILETYQRADGSVEIPEVLRRYVGTDVIRSPRSSPEPARGRAAEEKAP